MAVTRMQGYVFIDFNRNVFCLLTIVGFFDQSTSKNTHFVVSNLDHKPTYKAETAQNNIN